MAQEKREPRGSYPKLSGFIYSRPVTDILLAPMGGLQNQKRCTTKHPGWALTLEIFSQGLTSVAASAEELLCSNMIFWWIYSYMMCVCLKIDLEIYWGVQWLSWRCPCMLVFEHSASEFILTQLIFWFSGVKMAVQGSDQWMALIPQKVTDLSRPFYKDCRWKVSSCVIHFLP